MGWRRRTRVLDDTAVSPFPPGLTPLTAAQQAVSSLLADPVSQELGFESAEVVHLQSAWPADQVAGVSMRWTQRDHRFGLLMPIERLASQSGGLDSVLFYLRLAFEEPHEGSPDGSRTWLTDLPSGPY